MRLTVIIYEESVAKSQVSSGSDGNTHGFQWQVRVFYQKLRTLLAIVSRRRVDNMSNIHGLDFLRREHTLTEDGQPKVDSSGVEAHRGIERSASWTCLLYTSPSPRD